ncbi:hypothetical protein V6N13_106269 [Hibiscus sabdariffa]|uniref:Uncharacterized protein n=1 Tax=Hibiscus sabdariffa TaxID=183260 RepID=A0ABR2F089_9ROSI
MLSQGNPFGTPSTLRHLDEFGGWPPDGIPVIPALQSLERPSSPTMLEGQSVMKKVRSSVDVGIDSDRVAMDAEHGVDVESDARETAVRSPSVLQEQGQRTTSHAGDGGTYAS